MDAKESYDDWLEHWVYDDVDATKRSWRNRKKGKRRLLTRSQILRWADAHRARTGAWPTVQSGIVHEAPDETWARIGGALIRGFRGLPGGSSLPKLLRKARGVRHSRKRRDLRIRQLLLWADAYYIRHGTWPCKRSGIIPESNGLTWAVAYRSLRRSKDGAARRRTLDRLLAQRRIPKVVRKPSNLTIAEILEWADDFFFRNERWPSRQSGGIPGKKGLSWRSIDSMLCLGKRGLPGGMSLKSLLLEERGGIASSIVIAGLTPE
jgi:hypothetical protein